MRIVDTQCHWGLAMPFPQQIAYAKENKHDPNARKRRGRPARGRAKFEIVRVVEATKQKREAATTTFKSI
jgi:hypothetical protein